MPSLLTQSLSSLPAAPAGDGAPATDQDSPQVTLAGQSLGALPGSWLYNIKLFLERVRLWLIRSSEGKADYMVELINRRSAEIAELVRTGRTKFVEKAAWDQERLIRQVQDRVGQLGVNAGGLGLLDRVEEAVGLAWDTLAGALSGLPEKAQRAVNGIMQRVAQRARQFWDDLDKAIRGTGQGAAKDLLERLKPRRNWRDGEDGNVDENEGKGPQGK